MNILRRILIGFAVLFAAQYFVVPAVVLYFARRAPAVARVVPTDLKDLAVSQAPGTKLSCVGYELEVPWSDVDQSQTAVSEGGEGFQTAGICLRSGLKLFISARPLQKGFPEYAFLKQVYAVTPDQFRYWTLFKGGHYRDARLLLAKSALLENIGLGFKANPAENGILEIRSPEFKGFQYGDPQNWQPVVELSLYSDDGSVKIRILQKDYDRIGVTQPEINRIVQSLHRTAKSDSKSVTAAASK